MLAMLALSFAHSALMLFFVSCRFLSSRQPFNAVHYTCMISFIYWGGFFNSLLAFKLCIVQLYASFILYFDNCNLYASFCMSRFYFFLTFNILTYIINICLNCVTNFPHDIFLLLGFCFFVIIYPPSYKLYLSIICVYYSFNDFKPS